MEEDISLLADTRHAVKLETDGMGIIREAAEGAGFKVIGVEAPYLYGVNDLLLPKFCRDEVSGAAVLNTSFVVGAEEAEYDHLVLANQLCTTFDKMASPPMERIYYDNNMSYKRFRKVLNPALIQVWEKRGRVMTDRNLYLDEGTNIPGDTAQTERSASVMIAHKIAVYPDLEMAEFAHKSKQRMIKVNGAVFKSARIALAHS